MSASRRIGALFGAFTVACVLAVPAWGADTCARTGYYYAGLGSGKGIHGVRASITALEAPVVRTGHVSAWVGVRRTLGRGGPASLRAGLLATSETGNRLFYEIRRRSGVRRWLGRSVAAGARHRAAVVEMFARPGWWRVWIDGRAVSRPIRLRAGAQGWRPIATGESRNAAGGSCNRFSYGLHAVAVAKRARPRWRPIEKAWTYHDAGYELIRSSPRTFLARTRLSSLTSDPGPMKKATRDQFGMASGSGMPKLSASELAQTLDGYVAAGSRWIRFDLGWAWVQAGGPTSYDWAPWDKVVLAARERGLDVLLTIAYTPTWALPAGATDFRSPPANVADYAGFAAEAVRHYAPLGVRHWEIWNEPNLAYFWRPQANAAAYTELLKAAYATIKQVDPGAVVLTGGLSPAGDNGSDIAPPTFVHLLYAYGAKGYFDALAHHPYTGSEFPSDSGWSAWAQTAATMPSLRSLMTANGDSAKQIWATEFGVPTNGERAHWIVSEADQARMVTTAYELWGSYSWAGPLFWYSYRDRGVTADTIQNFFGLVRNDFTPKPAFAAYQAAAAAAE